MIFHKPSKQAMVHPPKTGTITMHNFLRAAGWKALPNTHAKTERFIKDYPNLNDYTIYGFFRDPLKRFESAVLYVKRTPNVSKNFEKIVLQNGFDKTAEMTSYDTVVDIFLSLKDAMPVFFRPQTVWLDHPKVTTLDFDNFESELRRITGDYKNEIPVLNKSTDFGRSVITDKVREFVRDYYAADYQFAKDVLGKEY